MTEEELQSQIKYGESEFCFPTHNSGGKEADKNRHLNSPNMTNKKTKKVLTASHIRLIGDSSTPQN